MKFNRLLVLLCLLFYVQLCHSWLISAGIVGAGIFGGYEIVKCKFFECCTKDYVANNLTGLYLNSLYTVQQSLFYVNCKKFVMTIISLVELIKDFCVTYTLLSNTLFCCCIAFVYIFAP